MPAFSAFLFTLLFLCSGGFDSHLTSQVKRACLSCRISSTPNLRNDHDRVALDQQPKLRNSLIGKFFFLPTPAIRDELSSLPKPHPLPLPRMLPALASFVLAHLRVRAWFRTNAPSTVGRPTTTCFFFPRFRRWERRLLEARRCLPSKMACHPTTKLCSLNNPASGNLRHHMKL